MELGALICKPRNPLCNQCPIIKNCKSYKNKDFSLTKKIKKNKDKYFVLKVYKKKQRYLLIKNTKFNFLKNLSIFPMVELSNPKNFNENLNFKMSNMNMNIKIEYSNDNKKFPYSYWVDGTKMNSYMLPSFTKKNCSILREKLMKKIAIIGAGISGLFIANLFKKNSNYQITVYEKSLSINLDEGYGIQLSVNSVKLLNQIGFDKFKNDQKFNPDKINFYSIESSNKICDLNISDYNSAGCKYTTLKRSELVKFLKKDLENVIKINHSISKIVQQNQKIQLIFENNETSECDHLIISDGVFQKVKVSF